MAAKFARTFLPIGLNARAIKSSQAMTEKTVRNDHPLFERFQVAPNIWKIEEKYFDSWNLANMYFVEGCARDLLVDTGVGLHDLPSYLIYSGLRKKKSKPLTVVLTHAHFDHSGGAHLFQDQEYVTGVHIHAREFRALKYGSKYETAAWVTPEEILPKPLGWTSAKDYHVKPVGNKSLKNLGEGDVFDLGGDLSVQVHHFPGHSPGSIGLRIKDALVTGDTVYATDDELIDWYPGSSVREMAASVKRILEIVRRSDVDLVLPGHNDVLSKDQSIEACERHLKSCATGRIFRKSLSRTRASLFLSLNHFGIGVTKARDWIKH